MQLAASPDCRCVEGDTEVTPEAFLVQFINGLQLGSIYALIALGYTMVYGIVKLINFAHGDILMVGSYVIMFMMGTVFTVDSVIARVALWLSPSFSVWCWA